MLADMRRKSGSIPACAGEPSIPVGSTAGGRVYPRVCGGTRSGVRVAKRAQGLSPRVRGNLVQGDDRAHQRGSIPACAGEPVVSAIRQPLLRVYPRVCGGTGMPECAAVSDRGLSPRVRGNQADIFSICATIGSIPACAGEPSAIRISSTLMTVYPRVCGGTSYSATTRSRPEGLSPRVRGNPPAEILLGRVQGSIPACAGEPDTACPPRLPRQVYPRVCGGTGGVKRWPGAAAGLSPRVRGNPPAISLPAGGGGSIPACAGEPLPTPCSCRCVRVYPRVCGGTAVTALVPAAIDGLSPRVRGNPATG